MSGTIAAGPRQVEFPAIERELEALWTALPAARDPGGAASMRAVVANLIAVRDSKTDLAAAEEVIGNIIGNHPCRLILATSQPDLDPPGLTAEVAVLCRQSETCQRCVCCDLIRLAAHGITADNLPSMTATLLAPDLPVIVWWPKPPFGRKDFGRFAEQADRVIVDSAAYAPADLLQLAVFLAQTRRTRTAVSDLNWARLTAYRQIFAQFFDAPECRDHLASIHSIRIEAAPAAGLLLAGWLKAQMDKNGYVLPRERITLVPTGPDVFSFRSLVLTCAGGKNSFTVTRQDAHTLEARTLLNAQTLTHMAKAEFPAEDKLLGAELEFTVRDTVFESALASAAAL